VSGIDACSIHVNATVREALLALQRSATQVVLVVDDERRLLGILTDGDLRRAFLEGATVNSPVHAYLNPSFVHVDPLVGRVEVLELMQAMRISVVPIVDGARRPLGVHLLHDVVRVQKRRNWAVIMAGGRGTRLGLLTDSVPKPMMRVAGRPIVERLVLHLAGFGFEKIYLAINYLGHLIEDHFGDGSKFGCTIHYLREDCFLGSGGALSLLPSSPTDPVVVMNGDLVTSADVGGMLDFHCDNEQVATVGLHNYAHTVPFGCVDVDGDRVLRLEEKPTVHRLVNAGIYVLNPELIARVPKNQEFPMPTLIDDALRRGEIVRGFEVQGDWIDVGQREQLAAARGGQQ